MLSQESREHVYDHPMRFVWPCRAKNHVQRTLAMNDVRSPLLHHRSPIVFWLAHTLTHSLGGSLFSRRPATLIMADNGPQLQQQQQQQQHADIIDHIDHPNVWMNRGRQVPITCVLRISKIEWWWWSKWRWEQCRPVRLVFLLSLHLYFFSPFHSHTHTHTHTHIHIQCYCAIEAFVADCFRLVDNGEIVVTIIGRINSSHINRIN